MNWIMEDEDDLLELYEFYVEARKQVDKKYPRRGDNQTKAILEKFKIDQWMRAHSIMFYLRDTLAND